MVKEVMNILKINNGFVVTTSRRDATFCPDEEAVAAHVRLKLAEYAEEEAPIMGSSAITPQEWQRLDAEWKETHKEGENA